LTNKIIVSIITLVILGGIFMKVDVRNLLKSTGNTLDLDLKGSSLDLTKQTPVMKEVWNSRLRQIVSSLRHTLKLTGKISLSYLAQCARCLEPVNSFARKDLEECFYPKHIEDSEAEYFYEDKTLDLSPFLLDCILLDLMDTKVLCDEEW
jgi:uncharacterized metal-binding protein YceD (DUF177 family)